MKRQRLEDAIVLLTNAQNEEAFSGLMLAYKSTLSDDNYAHLIKGLVKRGIIERVEKTLEPDQQSQKPAGDESLKRG